MSTPNNPQPPTTTNDLFYQKVVFEQDAHTDLLAGARVLASAVKSTMGPSGHSVIIDNPNGGAPLITKDGVTVAKSIHLRDRMQSIGAELLKEVAAKTNEQAGDGTTTATVLGFSMLENGIRTLSTGRSSIELKRGMDKATELASDFLKRAAMPISLKLGISPIANIATISANGDREIGTLISNAIDEVGESGIVTFESSKSIKTTLNVVQGMQLKTGYVSPFFITNSDKATCEMVNPLILITSNKISNLQDIVPILQKASTDDRPLLIVCENLEAEALHTCIVNKTKGVVEVCAIKAPSYGEHRADTLADLATVTGAEVIGVTTATSLKNLDFDKQLGTCAKVIVSRTTTTFVTDPADENVKTRTEKLASDVRSVLENDKTLDDLRISRYRERLARLAGGVAVIQVGGATELEIREKRDRVEDAVNATFAAIQEGVVPGGGTALFYTSLYLKSNLISNVDGINDETDDFKAGYKVIVSACEEPMKVIVTNTGASFEVVKQKLMDRDPTFEAPITHEVVAHNMMLAGMSLKEVEAYLEDRETKIMADRNTFCYGYNARTKEFGDMVNHQVIDPVKVTRLALTHANSVVGLMLTCNAIVLNEA